MSGAAKLYEDLNKISPQLQKYVDSQKPAKGKMAKFKMLSGEPNPDPKTNRDTPYYHPLIESIPMQDEIKDPGTGKKVRIGVVDFWNPDNGVPEFKRKRIHTRLQMAQFEVDPEDDEFMFLVLTSRNASYANRDKAVVPMFEQINEVANARKRVQGRNLFLDASVLLRDMPYSSPDTDTIDMQNMAAAYSITEYFSDPDMLRDALFDKMEADPQAFIDKINSPDLQKYVLVKRAFEEGLITHDAAQNRIADKNGNTIAPLPRTTGTWQENFVEWLNTASNGDTELQSLKLQLDGSGDGDSKSKRKRKGETIDTE